MALGDYNNSNSSSNNGERKYREPIVYSPYGVSNTEGVDPSALSYQFYNGMLKISIAPLKMGAKVGENSKNIWDTDNAISVWLTHVKAKMFAEEIKYVMANMDTVNNSGVNTGADGLISFSTGKELGATSPCLIIRKVNQETGEVTTAYAYQFRNKYYGTIRNFDPHDPGNFEHINHPNLEIENLINILEDFSRSINGAYAYSYMNASKYDSQRLNNKIELIMDKLGIERQNGDYSKSGSNRSFFNNNNGKSSEEDSLVGTGGMRSTTLSQLSGDMQ